MFSSMTVKLLSEHHLEFLSLKGGCTGSSKSTPVIMPHCLKSHVAAHMEIVHCIISPSRQQWKTLLTIGEHRTKLLETSDFDCHLSLQCIRKIALYAELILSVAKHHNVWLEYQKVKC